MKGVWQVALGVVCGLLAAGLILLVAAPPRGEAIRLLPPPTAAPLAVHVNGAVASPGVYWLPPGSRVAQAIQAAGGALPQADEQALNLAAPLHDGEQVRVPTQAREETAWPTSEASRSLLAPSGAPSLININTATQSELESLPGIGPVLAQRIIEYRQAHGPFTRLEDLLNVPGIGPKTFERIKDLITL